MQNVSMKMAVEDKARKETAGMNEVWKSTAQFLGALNGENIKRDSYVRIPEFIEAEQMWKEKQEEWDTLLSASTRR